MEKEILRMEFIFDSKKLEANGITKEYILNPIRAYFSKYNVNEISEGVFDSADLENTTPFFSIAMNLPEKEIFMKNIKEWYWYIDNDKEDCLKEYYRVIVRNA